MRKEPRVAPEQAAVNPRGFCAPIQCSLGRIWARNPRIIIGFAYRVGGSAGGRGPQQQRQSRESRAGAEAEEARSGSEEGGMRGRIRRGRSESGLSVEYSGGKLMDLPGGHLIDTWVSIWEGDRAVISEVNDGPCPEMPDHLTLALDRSLGNATPRLEADCQEPSGDEGEWSTHRTLCIRY